MNDKEKSALHEAFYEHSGNSSIDYDGREWSNFVGGWDAGKAFALPAPAASEAPSIDTPMFRMLAVDYRRAIHLHEQHSRLDALIGHIDQHVAAAVAHTKQVLDLVQRQYAELETALAEEHAELVKLRAQVPQAGAGADDASHTTGANVHTTGAAPVVADDAPDLRQTQAEAYDDAISTAAMYVLDHCVDGESHAEIITAMKRPEYARTAPQAAELPALPEGVEIEYGSPAFMEAEYPGLMYTAEQMQEYARAALALRQPQGECYTMGEIADACAWAAITKPEYQAISNGLKKHRAMDAVAAKQAGKE